MSGLTDWLRRRGEYPGPGVPMSPEAVDIRIADLVEARDAAVKAAIDLANDLSEERRRAAAMAARVVTLHGRISANDAAGWKRRAERDRSNAVVLSDRAEQLRLEVERLEAEKAELRRELEVFGVVPPCSR